MKIIVLVKETPDTEAKILINPQGGLDLSQAKYILNPYDEFAVEEALKTKDKYPESEVVVLCLGNDGARERILKALAMGADRGLLISDDGIATQDSFVVAKVLAKAIESEKADLVLCGKQGIDADNMHTHLMVAELLSWVHVNVVTKMDWVSQDLVKVSREVEGGQVEEYEIKLPCVLGAHKSLNTPRYASLPGIMKAKKKPLDKKTAADLGLSSSDLSPRTRVEKFTIPPQKPAGKLFKGEPLESMVDQVISLLKNEAKVL